MTRGGFLRELAPFRVGGAGPRAAAPWTEGIERRRPAPYSVRGNRFGGKGRAMGERGVGPSDEELRWTDKDETPYSIGDVAAALNLSRATLLYYERRGIVSPHQDAANGYRSYTDADIFRLIESITLKNVGIQPRDVLGYLDGDPFSPERFDEYDALIDRQVERALAMRERLGALRRLPDQVGVVSEGYVEPYYISFGKAPVGFRDYEDDPVLDALVANVPISSMGALFFGDYFDLDSRPRFGRTVPVRLAHLVGELPTGLTLMGGCRCVMTSLYQDDIYQRRTQGVTMSGRVREYLADHNLTPTGRTFCPYSLLTESRGFYTAVCLPVA